MTARPSKLKELKIFGCPECRARFTSVMAVNIHLKKSHDADFQIYLAENGRAYTRKTLTVKVACSS